jgi:hypothetical protein
VSNEGKSDARSAASDFGAGGFLAELAVGQERQQGERDGHKGRHDQSLAK